MPEDLPISEVFKSMTVDPTISDLLERRTEIEQRIKEENEDWESLIERVRAKEYTTNCQVLDYMLVQGWRPGLPEYRQKEELLRNIDEMRNYVGELVLIGNTQPELSSAASNPTADTTFFRIAHAGAPEWIIHPDKNCTGGIILPAQNFAWYKGVAKVGIPLINGPIRWYSTNSDLHLTDLELRANLALINNKVGDSLTQDTMPDNVDQAAAKSNMFVRSGNEAVEKYFTEELKRPDALEGALEKLNTK